MATDLDADQICREQEQLASQRSNFDNLWQRVVHRVLPNSDQFTELTMEGQSKTQRLFTSLPVTANSRFAAFIHEGMTPRDQIWHGLAPEDDALKDNQSVSRYLDRVSKALFAQRYRPLANFTSQRHDCYLSAGAIGNYCLFVDEDIGFGARYKSLYIAQVWWSENHQGIIDCVYYKFEMTGRNVMARAKDNGWEIPARMAKVCAEKPFDNHTFIFAVRPNTNRTNSYSHDGMPWSSYYVAVEDKVCVSKGGFRTFPFAIGRIDKAPNEIWSRSPAMNVFGSILTLNEQKKTVLRAGQLVTEPPSLLTEEGILGNFSMAPGAMNYGGLNSQGEPMIKSYETKGRVDIGVDLMGIEERDINDGFMVSLFQILADHPQMTATEVLNRMQERAQLLSPMTARLESEDLGPMILRELDILSRDSAHRWIIDEMPEELIEAGGNFKIVYESPLAKSRRASEALAITRSLEVGTVAAGLDPNAMLVMDVPEAYRTVCEINGVPADIMRSKEDVAALLAERERQQQMMAIAQLAPGVAGAARDVAQAEQIRQTAAA